MSEVKALTAEELEEVRDRIDCDYGGGVEGASWFTRDVERLLATIDHLQRSQGAAVIRAVWPIYDRYCREGCTGQWKDLGDAYEKYMEAVKQAANPTPSLEAPNV